MREAELTAVWCSLLDWFKHEDDLPCIQELRANGVGGCFSLCQHNKTSSYMISLLLLAAVLSFAFKMKSDAVESTR